MITGPKDDEEDRQGEPDDSAAIKVTDAAVRRALLESRQDLLAFLLRRLGSREEAEDVLQRFSIRAMERASDLRDVRTVRGWLGRILANMIVDHQRRAIRRRRREVAMEQTSIENLRGGCRTRRGNPRLYKLLPASNRLCGHRLARRYT